MGDGYTLDPGVMTAVAGDLSDAAGTVRGQQGALAVKPDAGASSGEVADAFAGLASALTALAGTLEDISDNVTQAVSTYQSTDTSVGHGFSAVPR